MIKKVLEKYGLDCNEILAEAESAEYGAHILKSEGMHIRFRIAKITPTKVGQFVTFWKRKGTGPIMPFDTIDEFDFLMVLTCDQREHGYFMFPKSALITQDIISVDKKGGKRAFRVYPPWVKTASHQATETQKWQLNYFRNGKIVEQ